MNTTRLALTATAAACLAPVAAAEVTFEMIGLCRATDVSADGSVIAGNSESWGTFRWTRETGIVDLGRNAFIAIGRGAGAPSISADGTRISASILDASGQYLTPGRWTLDEGWTDLIPPVPPDGGLLDDAYGSAWGLSPDGETVTGLYWRPGRSGGLAHAFAWTEDAGLVDLGSAGGNSRANDANADGSVIVGWDEHPVNGLWRPAVWVDGARTILSHNDAFTQAACVTPDGTMIGGSSYAADTRVRVAAVWRRSGDEWIEEKLGALTGTLPDRGVAIAYGISADGRIVVGYNAYDFQTAAGFIWTEKTGMMKAKNFLADHGIEVDPLFRIQTLSSISEDGTTIVGIGQDQVFPFSHRSFIITLPPFCPADLDGNGVVDVADILLVLAGWGGPDGDVNGDGTTDVADILRVLAAWGSCE